MSVPLYMNMPGGTFGYSSMMDSQSYAREDGPMEMMNVWDSGMVDPSQRGADGSMSFFHDWNEQEQPMQRYLVEPQKMLFTTGHLHSFQAQANLMDFNKPYDAPGPIPHGYEQSHRSPSSICSSATSLPTESDWMHEKLHARQYQEDCAMSPTHSHMFQERGGFDLSYRSPSRNHHPMVRHINMSEVQSYPDPEEVTFQEDEGVMDMETKMDFVTEAESQVLPKPESCRGHYPHMSDEGIGRESLKSDSPEPMESKPTIHELSEADIDAEGEDVEELEDEINDIEVPVLDEEDEYQDTDYKPKAPRTKSRRPTRTSTTSPANKRYKVNKSTSSSKSKLRCKTCGDTYRHSADLLKHITSVHTRPYICTFSFAGCESVFGNKNEWKRHVASQHLALRYWVCEVGSCGVSSSSSSSRNASAKNGASTNSNGSSSSRAAHQRSSLNHFNRKDLFTQHLRRMHTKISLEVQRMRKSADWEEQIRSLQDSCLRIRREPPSKTKCPVRACGQLFEGPGGWDERMEHVGRHLEKIAPSGKNGAAGTGMEAQDVVEQESDEFMIEWALRERIIERKAQGGYQLWTERRAVSDESDADGEVD